jgi:hypothetical protein
MKTTVYSILFAIFIIASGLTISTKKAAAENSISTNSLIMEASHTKFCDGFYVGFRAGYCYNRNGCIPPPPPICPIPNAGESWNSYRDGYNRGFLVGFHQ